MIAERVAAHGVVVTCREQDNHHYYKIFADSVKTLLEAL